MSESVLLRSEENTYRSSGEDSDVHAGKKRVRWNAEKQKLEHAFAVPFNLQGNIFGVRSAELGVL